MTPNPTNGIIRQNELEYRRCVGGGYIPLQPFTNAVTRRVTGLTINTEYCFRVRAYTVVSFGSGNWTEEVMGRTCKLLIMQVIIV